MKNSLKLVYGTNWNYIHITRNIFRIIIPSKKQLLRNYVSKELSLRNKIKYLNHNIFRTRCCKPLIFQTQII